jgi:hypothetical protein
MLVEWVRRLRGPRANQDELLPEAVERVVAATDSRLALLPGYRKVLMPGMRKTLEYVASLGDRLPGVVDLSLLSFTLDRRLGLFFSSPVSLLGVLLASAELKEYFSCASNGDEACALLLMQRTDTLRFGMVNEGGEIRSDVAQTVVSFDRHRLILPCETMEDVRQKIPGRGLDVLTGVIARRLASMEKERGDLECELMRIKMRLASLAHPGAVMIDAMPGGDVLPESRSELVKLRDRLSERLAEVKAASEMGGVLELVAHMLQHPEDYFRVERTALHLDRMGVMQPAGDRGGQEEGESATEICQEEVMVGSEPVVSRVVMPVHVSRAAIAELERRVADGN